MYTVKFRNPYTDNMESKKFKGRQFNAANNAYSYAQKTHQNYYQTVEVHGFETMGGKKTGQEFTFKGNAKNKWF